MEKEIKINIPEGYDDAVFDPETKTVKFIKKTNKYRTWEDFSDNAELDKPLGRRTHIGVDGLYNYKAGVKYVKPIDALSKLLMLRKSWVGDWECKDTEVDANWCIVRDYDGWIKSYCFVIKDSTHEHAFPFPTEEMAKEFLECFKDLFEETKELISYNY